jgi:hypothetical protein
VARRDGARTAWTSPSPASRHTRGSSASRRVHAIATKHGCLIWVSQVFRTGDRGRPGLAEQPSELLVGSAERLPLLQNGGWRYPGSPDSSPCSPPWGPSLGPAGSMRRTVVHVGCGTPGELRRLEPQRAATGVRSATAKARVEPRSAARSARDYDPLARPAKPPVKPEVIAHQRSLTSGVPTDLPRGATGANGHGGAGDEREEELLVIPE